MARAAGVLLLTPLVLLVGLVAVVVLTALALGRRAGVAHAVRPPATLVRRREPAATDAALGVVARPAA